MHLVLKISTVLGVIGVVAAFILFSLGERVFHLDHAHLQTLMYLKLSVAGHMTIFLTRTRGPLWSIRPAKPLLIAVLGTQTIATLIAVYGLFMTPLGWGLAAFVWVYAALWALFTDRVKLLAYRIFDPVVPNTHQSSERKLKLVHRVHKFYEKMEREEIREIGKWEKHEQETHPYRKHLSHKKNK
jgi:H+-transporting ATPase